jgi:LysM repeat protein
MMYTVKAGYTLSKIAKAYGMTFEQLLNANPKYRAHPDGIRVGAQVNIPLSAGQAQEAANWLGTLSAKYETGGQRAWYGPQWGGGRGWCLLWFLSGLECRVSP